MGFYEINWLSDYLTTKLIRSTATPRNMELLPTQNKEERGLRKSQKTSI
jgi:hypothetical protein